MNDGRDAALLAGSARPAPADPNMIWIPGGTFRMGSDKHYPEEAPAHRVTVDGFWIDRTPVTNRDFRKFVNATGHVTFAEIKPDAKDYPGALPHMLKAGSLVFTPPKHPVDTARLEPVVEFQVRRRLAPALWAAQRRSAGSTTIRSCTSPIATREAYAHMGRQGAADRSRVGVRRTRRPGRRRIRLGR